MEPSPHATFWPVMILAHNEEKHITACLDSLYKWQGQVESPLRVFVMANGCSDRTEELVHQYAGQYSGLELVSLNQADKCNAWNVFIHEIAPRRAPNAEIYFFMDGDARATPGALSELAQALRSHPHALAAAGLPVTGRSMNRDRRKLLTHRQLVANLYALSGSFVRALQLHRVRLPIGLEGDDGLLGALVKWNLNPRGSWDDTRIVPCPSAGFAFQSLSWFRPADWKTYWRRRLRYGRRQLEFDLLGPRLKQAGLQALPADIRELYPFASECRLRWRGLQTFFDWLALNQLRRHAAPVAAGQDAGRPTHSTHQAGSHLLQTTALENPALSSAKSPGTHRARNPRGAPGGVFPPGGGPPMGSRGSSSACL